MNQLNLFYAAATPAESWPYTYRMVAGHYVVSTSVDGVGRISYHHRSLWNAVQMMRRDVTAALAAAPSEMF